MDISHLNDQQRSVVLHGDEPLLVIAAAGTGKTETLTTRIAYLIRVRDVNPQQILAVTFTNKAATEMRHRACRLAGLTTESLMIGTFHGICLRILRTMSPCPMLRRLSVIPQADAHRMIKECCVALNITRIEPPSAAKLIDEWRNDGISPQNAPRRCEPYASVAKVYEAYRGRCIDEGVTDFADILMHVKELASNDPEFKERLRNRWSHVFVDEFQDTNIVQLELIKLIVGGETRITVVGDDSQAIHEWRGAKVENILRFGNHFPGMVQKVLEINYRSVQTVLTAADNVIQNNPNRFDKQFRCTKEAGEDVSVVEYEDEDDEAHGVARRIKRRGPPYSDHVILYRVNAQSQRLEAALRALDVPYRIVGNAGFFERAEVKDAISYLRLSTNPSSKADFLRVINTPSRGVGPKSIQDIISISEDDGVDFVAAIRKLSQRPKVRKDARSGLIAFLNVIDGRLDGTTMPSTMKNDGVAATTYKVIYGSGLVGHAENDINRVENLRHLVKIATAFEMSHPEGDVNDFVSSITLVETLTQDENQYDDCVTLMTMHASKGLEFENVHVIGMAEEIMPFVLAVREGRIEEERRLAYVAITRAKRHLTLSYPKKRMAFGNSVKSLPSRFIEESQAFMA